MKIHKMPNSHRSSPHLSIWYLLQSERIYCVRMQSCLDDLLIIENHIKYNFILYETCLENAPMDRLVDGEEKWHHLRHVIVRDTIFALYQYKDVLQSIKKILDKKQLPTFDELIDHDLVKNAIDIFTKNFPDEKFLEVRNFIAHISTRKYLLQKKRNVSHYMSNRTFIFTNRNGNEESFEFDTGIIKKIRPVTDMIYSAFSKCNIEYSKPEDENKK